MSLINNGVDIGDLMLMIDENYYDDINEYDERVLESVEEFNDTDIDSDVADTVEDDGSDDYVDIANLAAAEFAEARDGAIDPEIDDEVMDIVIDDEEEDIEEEDIEEYGYDDDPNAQLEEYMCDADYSDMWN